jgi:hypothetical protein
MTYHRPRHSLGTRDLLAATENLRRARHTRASALALAFVMLAFIGAYAASLGLAVSLEYIRHLFQ